jgi:hypothetical protein
VKDLTEVFQDGIELRIFVYTVTCFQVFCQLSNSHLLKNTVLLGVGQIALLVEVKMKQYLGYYAVF